jgi:hypothetical protein
MTEAYGLIDEAMLPVLADQVPIEWAGEIYCIVLHHCHKVADLPTQALMALRGNLPPALSARVAPVRDRATQLHELVQRRSSR